MHCKCFNISFWSPLSLQNKKIKKGKRIEMDEGLIIFCLWAETVEAWWTGDVFAKRLISVIFCLYTDHLEIFRTLLTSGAIYRSPQLMILTRQNFSYLSLITAVILCKPQIHLMKNTQLLFLAKQINQCFVEHV